VRVRYRDCVVVAFTATCSIIA